DKKARFRTVLLDPELAATAPPRVVATAGIDAITHAIESAVTRRGNPVSRMLSREAWRRLDASFERYLAKPGDLTAAADMLLGSHLAGAAIEASMLGAAHACANPLTAHYGIVHGTAVGLMLPAVIRFNAEVAGELYRELDAGGAEGLATRFEELRKAAGLPARLRDAGVDQGRFSQLAEEAAKQWTGTFNPRPAGVGEMLALYREVF
ncbi:MAG TPA: iron-containing alcohol dehydrogenase, partial [Thermoanaerobaculia bacterium]|nr:iron-containing alcohol dehydrogenase [Thermoanaerobaculia bacterium]